MPTQLACSAIENNGAPDGLPQPPTLVPARQHKGSARPGGCEAPVVLKARFQRDGEVGR